MLISNYIDTQLMLMHDAWVSSLVKVVLTHSNSAFSNSIEQLDEHTIFIIIIKALALKF